MASETPAGTGNGMKTDTGGGAAMRAGAGAGVSAGAGGGAGADTGGTWFAPLAWLAGRWQRNVVLETDAAGRWQRIQADQPCPPQAERLTGPVLPPLVNGHSHAFQRAFAGLAERRQSGHDDFWSWRDRMYAAALRVNPEQQQAIAAQLFVELLRGGYTHVCEFHYLHRQPDASAWPGAGLDMAAAILAAARETGIGITLIPVVYERAGFDQPGLREDQRRFAANAQAVLAMRDALRGMTARETLSSHGNMMVPGEMNTQAGASARLGEGNAAACAAARAAAREVVGVGLHSLRAASPAAFATLLQGADGAPVHIHAAEQTAEVEACLAATGLRPVEWLVHHAPLDQRWQLVHATHCTRAEIEAVGRSGAGIVLCPGTEANLGDGIPDLDGWLSAGVPITLGTDSHVTRAAPEELRLLEGVQRLTRRARCVLADPQGGQPSTGERLWSLALGGGAAAGLGSWGLQVGARADLLVLDSDSPSLLGIPDESLLDALVFSSPARPFRDVMVAGRWVSRDHRHPRSEEIAQQFKGAMQSLWQQEP